MPTLSYVLIVFLAAAWAVVLFLALRALTRFRGTRVVRCPETGKAAAVEIDLTRAVLAAATAKSDLSLKQCSRWPERGDCAQLCVQQIESSPEDCLVRRMLANWYRGKSCVFCRKPFEDIKWHDHQPAFIDADRNPRQWSEVSAENIPEILTTAKPVCWSCQIAESFRRRYAEMLVDRPWKPGEGLRLH
ncbi:MAG TPA: hypothetical protein VL754_10055 [Verrucomicrobiae bacterium]|jgi:hypothetical protein|nr:hypothetical protein [Verrucomicrobiae bacterium]